MNERKRIVRNEKNTFTNHIPVFSGFLFQRPSVLFVRSVFSVLNPPSMLALDLAMFDVDRANSTRLETWNLELFCRLSLPTPVPVTFFGASDMCFTQCLQATCHPVTTFTPWFPLGSP
jgi:hypothetical protein